MAVAVVPETELRIQPIAVGRLLPTQRNPRRELRELDDLVASIRRSGVLVPLTVESFGGNYRVIAGHRRLAAAKAAGLTSLPCIVREYSDDDRLEAMLIDNIQRNDLDPIELAEALDQLAARGLTQREIGDRVGKSTSYVSKHLQLLQLSAKDRRAVASGQLAIAEALGYLGRVDKGPEYCRSCGRRMPKPK